MLQVYREDGAIALELSSEIALVDEAISECNRYFEQLGITEPSSIDLVLQELLMNGIKHGNRDDASKRVKCRVAAIGERELEIEIEDEGQGFDYRNLRTSLPMDPRRIAMRGYILIKALSERIDFNESGNRITVHMRT